MTNCRGGAGALLAWGRLAVVGLLLMTLPGCVTVENSLSQNDIAAMRLTAVTVSFAPDSVILWDDGERAYRRAKLQTDDQFAGDTKSEECKEFMRAQLAPQIKSGVEKAMAGQLNGGRPVRLEIVVKQFAIPSVAQRVIVGGHPNMQADANLVDAQTGRVLLSNPKLNTFVPVGNGILGTAIQAAVDQASDQTPEGKLITSYGQTYRNWLMRT
ncbi:DUF6778 family protein [Bradyrhizobium sp. HKCCYLS20291]